MENMATHIAETAAPANRPYDVLDARELPPPKPLRHTLERLAEIEDAAVLVQINDRRPQHLYPKLDDRGYEYDTLESEGDVVTVIWKG